MSARAGRVGSGRVRTAGMRPAPADDGRANPAPSVRRAVAGLALCSDHGGHVVILDSLLHNSLLAMVVMPLLALVAYGVAIAIGACNRRLRGSRDD